MKSSDGRTLKKRFSHIIKHERMARALTQTELAEELGISQSALSKIENYSMTPTLLPWLAFCKAFDLPAMLPTDEKQYKQWAKSMEKILKPQRKTKPAEQLSNLF